VSLLDTAAGRERAQGGGRSLVQKRAHGPRLTEKGLHDCSFDVSIDFWRQCFDVVLGDGEKEREKREESIALRVCLLCGASNAVNNANKSSRPH